MHSCKLIALDMDGTLLGSDYAISESNQRWLLAAREEGVEFTIATGRQFKGLVQQYARQLNIGAPIVTMNGSAVWSADGELIESHSFTADDVQYLYDLACETEISFWAHMIDEVVDRAVFQQMMERRVWAKFVFLGQDLQVIDHIWERLAQRGGFEVTSTSRHNIEVNPPGVSKASGLAVVCARLGISPDQVAAIGDSLNDVPMFRFAGRAIAMDNASDEVRREADWITDSNDRDGVAAAVKRLLGRNE